MKRPLSATNRYLAVRQRPFGKELLQLRTEHLKYFLSLAETHSITKSSKALYTTHQNVSKLMRQVEEELGTTLFIRSAKGVELTPTGKLLLPVAKRTAADFSQLRADILALESRSDLKGELHILGSEIAHVAMLSSLIQIFAELYPSLTIRLDNDDPVNILREIALHPQMLGITAVLTNPEFHPLYLPYLKQVQLTALGEDQFYCTVSQSSPLAEAKYISLEQFVRYPFAAILPSGEGENVLTRLVTTHGGQVAFATNNYQTYIQAVQSGRYITMSSSRVHQKMTDAFLRKEELRLIPFQEDMRLNISLATHQHPNLSEAGQAFVRFVQNSYLYL